LLLFNKILNKSCNRKKKSGKIKLQPPGHRKEDIAESDFWPAFEADYTELILNYVNE
jgi:hypothetical protein